MSRHVRYVTKSRGNQFPPHHCPQSDRGVTGQYLPPRQPRVALLRELMKGSGDCEPSQPYSHPPVWTIPLCAVNEGSNAAKLCHLYSGEDLLIY